MAGLRVRLSTLHSASPGTLPTPAHDSRSRRLQMDRHWRRSTRSWSLSAVDIRPMTPSYKLPQLQLPGIRGPRSDYPFESLSVEYGTAPSNSNTSIQRPLARHRVMLSCRVIAYYGLIRASESLPATYGFAAESAAPKEIGLRWESRGSPIYSVGLDSRAASLTPVAPKSANDCCFLFGVSLDLQVTGSATTLVVSRPAQRSLALRPVGLPSRQSERLSRRLRRFRYLHRRSDSYRLARLSCRVGLALTEDQHLTRFTKHTRSDTLDK